MIRIRRAMVLCSVLGLGCAQEAGVTTAALSGPDDCRLTHTCEGLGPAEPTELVPPPSLEEIPRCEGEWHLEGERGPYERNEAQWIRSAVGYAERSEAMVGFPTFEYDAESHEHGAVMLWSTAVAFRTSLSAEALGGAGIEDVATQLERAQGYARAHGYDAALPLFERQADESGEMDSIALLSPAAVEVRHVDLCALGSPEPADVASVFRGAQVYAREQGFLGAIPTFEIMRGDGRASIGLILILPEHGYELSLPDAELSPFCGRDHFPICEYGPICIPGQWPWEGLCTSGEQTCGGLGQPCCSGFCENGQVCLFNGQYHGRTCGLPPPPDARFCGDGTCELDESCDCYLDCGKAPPICNACVNPRVVATYCVECPNTVPHTRYMWACEGEEPLIFFPGRCTVTEGACP